MTVATARMEQVLATSMERALATALPLPKLLANAAQDSPLEDDDYGALVELGFMDLALREEAGGLALDEASIAALWFVAGRYLLPVIVREQALVLAPLLARAGFDDALARLRAGKLRGGGRVLLDEPSTLEHCPMWAPLRAEIVFLLTPESAALFDASGARREARVAIDLGQGLATFSTLREVARFGLDVAGPLFRAWQIAVIAEAAGCADRALSLAVAHAVAREQFGRPIAQFQSVANMLADMKTDVDAARSMIARCLSVVDAGEADDLLAVARYSVPRAARAAIERAVQVHGGIGFTWEYGLHLFYRRALQIQASLGGADRTAYDVGNRYLGQILDSTHG